ncbi:MAG: hypothetical protein KKB51_08695 [Candidatus Riflebacteria bacterium]|nr:hypothetical protein [Candidatus Riflebacteria bacterium]
MFVVKNWLKLVWVVVLALAFFPVLGLIAQFSGSMPLAALAFEQAPRWLIGRADVDRLAYEAAAQADLLRNCREIAAGRLRLRLSPDVLAEDWKNSASAAVERLSQLLPGSPPLPVIEMRGLFDSYGCFNNPFSLGIDPEGDEPLRTVAHELTHLYLLWALIPGLPIDCPRWLNEGLAELVSGQHMGDDAAWGRYAMIRSRDLVDLYVVSPAFSWSGSAVEWHAREAAALLIELHGEENFRRMITGLRLARPFYSVYPIITGRSLETFESDWKERFARQRVLENLPADEIAARLAWLVDNRRMIEVQPLLNDLPVKYLAADVQQQFIGRARMHEARISLTQGDLRTGLGWLRGVNPNLPGYAGLRPLIEMVRKSDLALDPENSSRRPEKASPPRSLWQNWLIWLVAWLAAFVFAGSLVAAYHYLRALIVPWLRIRWQLQTAGGISFRWLVIGLTGLGGGWFLRFLVISMIPYSGLVAMPDLQRILLAETLVIILWLGLAWQLKHWEPKPTTPSCLDSLPETTLSPGRTKVGVFVTFLIAGMLPPILTAGQNGWQRMGFPLSHTVLVLLLFFAGSAAFALAVWSADRRWNCVPGRHFGPALIYAIFRGGLAADPWASIFALIAGWRLSELAQSSRRLWPVIFGDLLLCGPALLLCVGWFPVVDPATCFWYGGSGAVIWWGISAVILLFYRGVDSVSRKPD